MNKRKAENQRVKSAITSTLFDLMEKKEISDITITEIIRKAHVARASFYRNYSSKEDVLVTLVRDVLQDFRESADYDLSEVYTYRHIRRTFEYFRQHKSAALNLYRSGHGMMLLEELNHFHEEIAGTMPASSSAKYTLYIYIGALFNTVLMWLQDKNAVDLDTIARIFMEEWSSNSGSPSNP